MNVHVSLSLLLFYVFCHHTEALAQIGLFVDEHFGRNDISKRHEHLQNVLVPELLRQVIDEKVCPFWSCKHNTQHIHTIISIGILFLIIIILQAQKVGRKATLIYGRRTLYCTKRDNKFTHFHLKFHWACEIILKGPYMNPVISLHICIVGSIDIYCSVYTVVLVLLYICMCFISHF